MLGSILGHPIVKPLKRVTKDAWWRYKGRSIFNPPVPSGAHSVLFVCLGNICRSPFAEAIAARRPQAVAGAIRFSSAGIRTTQAAEPPLDARQAALRFGVSLDRHRPKSLTRELVASHDVIVVMEPGQRDHVCAAFPGVANRVFLLSLFDQDAGTRSVFRRRPLWAVRCCISGVLPTHRSRGWRLAVRNLRVPGGLGRCLARRHACWAPRISNGASEVSRSEVSSMRPLRVMFVNGSLFGGGAEHVIATSAHYLREAGHQVTIAVIHHGGEVKRELEREGFDVVAQIADGPGGGSSSGRLKRLIEERDIDVVHSHDLRSLIDGGICRLRSRRFAHMHTFHFGNYPFVSRKHLLMETLFARIPDQLVSVGHAQRDSLIKALRLPAHRIRTIWNGVDWPEGADANAEAAESTAPVRIGSVSTLGEQKGIPTLLQAARILKDRGHAFQLVIVGEGPMRVDLERRAAEIGVTDHVEFTGWKPEAAETMLPTFDIFVQSSYWEAMSVVILEAMAARRPIVATTVGENSLVLSDGESAILVPPKNAESLADGLARVITDVALRRRLADTAHEVYLEHFSGKAMADRYAAAYRECLTRRHAAAPRGARAQAALPGGENTK
jgi:glycosyltransferase involved in cell wall biosynthesis/protein-tyrosine-phosphatase